MAFLNPVFITQEFLGPRGWSHWREDPADETSLQHWDKVFQLESGPVLARLEVMVFGGRSARNQDGLLLRGHRIVARIKRGRYKAVDILPAGHCWIENEFDDGWDVENQFEYSLAGLMKALAWVDWVTRVFSGGGGR